MATEPAARGRSVAGVDVYDGYALERRRGEDDEEFQRYTIPFFKNEAVAMTSLWGSGAEPR